VNITCHSRELLARCEERGYALGEVMDCVVSQDGDQWTIDIEHPAYPRHPKPGFEPLPPPTQSLAHGPGTELKTLLAGWPFRIVATADCKCTSRAAYMDAQGCDWCESNIEEIVGWLRESAAERGLPFVDAIARLLVRRAISNARKAEAARARGSQRHD